VCGVALPSSRPLSQTISPNYLKTKENKKEKVQTSNPSYKQIPKKNKNKKKRK
jgi:hypothetical protein